MLKICANEKCPNLVPESLNPGIERKYCSAQCANAVNMRRYRARNSGAQGDGMIRTVGLYPCVHRTISPSAHAAETRFKKHLEHCMVNEGGPCSARFDVYDRKHECLVKAVLREDWDQLRRAEQGRRWTRIETTEQGMWASEAKEYHSILTSDEPDSQTTL